MLLTASGPPVLRLSHVSCDTSALQLAKIIRGMPGKLLVGFFNTAKANNNIKLFILCLTFKVLAFKVRV